MKSIFVFLTVCACSLIAAAADPSVLPVQLMDEQYVEAEDIATSSIYQVSTTIGHDVEIKLGENPSKNELWQVVSYDPARCRIKIEHKKKGFWPFTKEYAEIEIKGLFRGKYDVILQCGSKRITVRIDTF